MGQGFAFDVDMISIFNGRSRSLGQSGGAVFAQLSVDFRSHIHLFKGARLHVFLCIALHADENGWAYPGIETRIKQETGYNRETIILALNDLCAMTIEGHRVLLAYQPVNQSGEFQSNRYLIFPTAQEIQEYELDNPRRRKSRNFPADSPSAAFPNTVNPNSAKPNTVQPHSEKPHSKKNQPKVEPSEPKPQRKKKQSSVAGVDGVLAHRATIVEDMPVEQVEVFDQIDMLLAFYHLEGVNRLNLAAKLARDAATLDGAGDWRTMAFRIINCWRLCDKAHKAGRVGNATGFTGFFIHKLESLDDSYTATGDELADVRTKRSASDAVKLAQSFEHRLAPAAE